MPTGSIFNITDILENYKYNIFDFDIAVASFKSIVAICVLLLAHAEALPVLPRGLFLVITINFFVVDYGRSHWVQGGHTLHR